MLFLYTQLAPLELVGKFEYLPVPSSHDSETAYVDKFTVANRFLGSAEVNCRLTFEVLSLNDEWPIVSPITVWSSSVLNFIRALVGYKMLSDDPLSLSISNISSLPAFNSFLSGWLYSVVSFSGNKK